jgi:hypothetical protein
MAAEKRPRIWIPIVLALLGWVFAYVSPLYHEWRQQPRITAQHEEIDFVHFIATRIEITNSGKKEARDVQCLLPRFVFPGGGSPCSTTIRDITPYDVRYALDNLSNKKIFTIFNLPPKVTFGFNIYKSDFTSLEDYYQLNPSISYETVLDGVKVKTSKGDIPLTKKERRSPRGNPQPRNHPNISTRKNCMAFF